MHREQYKIRFTRGPSDGLLLTLPDFESREKLRMPARAALVRRTGSHCYELKGHWCAVYVLASQSRATEPDCPTVSLKYDFVGFELRETSVPCQDASMPCQDSAARRPRWLVALCKWFRNIPANFVNWMLEPIDDPLKSPSWERARDPSGCAQRR